MERYLYNSGIKKIEYYLKRYNLLDLKIGKLSEFADDYNYRNGYNKWLKNILYRCNLYQHILNDKIHFLIKSNKTG